MNTIPELNLLVLLCNKELYHKYSSYIDRTYLRDTYKELSYIYGALDGLHSKVEKDITLEELKAFFFVKYEEADRVSYEGIFDQLCKVEIDPSVGEVILGEIATRQRALRLSEAAFRFSNGTGDQSKLAEAIAEFKEPVATLDDDGFSDTRLSVLLENTIHRMGLRWRLDFLNKSLGSLRKNDFGFLFARPETGKTTFLASEVSHMLTQLNEDSGPIIWCNNEEGGDKVITRVQQAYFGVTLQQMMGNTRAYEERFQRETNGKFLFKDDANIHRNWVDRVVEKYKPSLIVIDQIDKIKGFANDREDLRLGAIYIWAREIAKAYCPVIGVCQANGTAEGRDWLTMDHVANSATAKQAEADWILGIGKTHAETAEFVRYLNISKNKLTADSDSIEALRHGRSTVLIEPTIARYKDIREYT